MTVKRKDIKKAIYNLKRDGKTSIEVINFIENKCFSELKSKTIVKTEKQIPFKSSTLNNVVSDFTKKENNFSKKQIDWFSKMLLEKFIVFRQFHSFFDNKNKMNIFLNLIVDNQKLTAVKYLRDECEDLKKEGVFSSLGLREYKDLVEFILQFLKNRML